MVKVEMYGSATCPFCHAAQRLLAGKGVAYEHYSVDGQPAVREEMEARSGQFTVPQIFIGGAHVGGFDELAELDADDALDPLLDA